MSKPKPWATVFSFKLFKSKWNGEKRKKHKQKEYQVGLPRFRTIVMSSAYFFW